MEEWLYQVFLRTGSVEAYLFLKELTREREGEVKNDNGDAGNGGRCDYQGIQPW